MISLTQYVQSDNDHTCYYQASSSFSRVQRVEMDFILGELFGLRNLAPRRQSQGMTNQPSKTPVRLARAKFSSRRYRNE